MTEFSAHRLGWAGLGWAVALLGFSRGANGPCGAPGWGGGSCHCPLQPGKLHPSVVTDVWVWSPNCHCHSSQLSFRSPYRAKIEG